MKKNILRQLIMLSKRLLYGFLIQLFLCTVLLAHTGNAQRKTIDEVRVSLNLKEKTLIQFFRQVESKTDFKFTYNNDMVDLKQEITIVEKNMTLYKVLEAVSHQTSLNFVQVNENIHVKAESSLKKEQAVEIAKVEDVTISGTVVDENGEPLPGATISVAGTSIGAVTDLDGKYTLEVPEGATLTFSFIGFEPQQVVVGSQSIINVAMQEDSSSLEEVVVVGYGTVQRKDLTGAISSVNNEDIKDLGATRLDQALLGKVAGVQIKPVSGEPGVAPQIRIRGIGSISAGASPLYVVDGFPRGSIETLNPNDIESIDVLKDASATAIYGSRGSNGVIIITTKRGKDGKAIINFDMHAGFQEISKRPIYMNAREQAQYHYEGLRQDNIDQGYDVSGPPESWQIEVPPMTLGVLDGTVTYDRPALDDVLRIAPQQQYQLSATGGNENIKYAISGEYMTQDGIILGSDFKRYSLRANIDAKLSNKISLRLNLNPSFIDRNVITASGSSSSQNEGVVGSALGVNPMYPLLNEDGSYFVFSPGLDVTPNAQNPLALARELTNKQKTINLMTNIDLEYRITEDLKINIMAGTVLGNHKGHRFKPQIPAFFNEPATGTDNASMSYNWLTEYTMDYTKVIGGHNFSALAGFSSQRETVESNTISSNRFPNNLVPTLSAVSNIITSGSSDIVEWSLVSYLGRVNYNYNSKYYATASFRTDGSSRFGSNNKYGVFPSAALAWRISDESFMQDLEFLSEMKIRASYGVTGNNNIGNYDHYATINYDRYILGEGVVGGFSQQRIGNPDLTWETQRSVNVGIDFAFFQRRILLTVDHFQSRNSNLLLNVNVPDITGFSTALTNIGEVKNEGWELVLNTTNLIKQVQWSTDFNISTFRNEVVRLGPTGDPIFGGSSHVTMIGQPIGMFFGWITDGIFMNQGELDNGPIFSPGGVNRSRVGDIRFVDMNNDGIIDNSDKVIMGSPYPDFYYGMTNNFSYKNLNLSISLQGSHGAQIFAESRAASMATRGRFGQLALSNDYWVSEEQPGDGKTPRPNNAPTGNVRGQWSDLFLDNGSYLRINNITLGYTLPESFSNRYKLGTIRIYTSANNPFIFTKNAGFNPEASNLENPLRPGRELSDYPIPRSILFGLNLGLNN